MLMFCICVALCVLVSLFLFRGSEVCFYDHFSDLVYFSAVFNLCVTGIHILCFETHFYYATKTPFYAHLHL